jgi:hypothetical protein
MKKILIIIIILNISASLFGQSMPKEYYLLAKQADSLYKLKEFKNSGLAYNKAFRAYENKGTILHKYNAACSWALSNFTDSAFILLNQIAITTKYSEYDEITKDEDLNSLHNDIRWTELIKLVKENKNKIEEKYNHKLIHLIDSMATEDQKWRGLTRQLANNEIDSIKYPRKIIYANFHLTDSLNYFLCKRILDNYGFPNYEIVGNKTSNNFWLLVQHQDLRVSFQDSALTKMKVEVDRGLASGSNYAYLIDRIRVNSNQFQIYGTQMQLNKEKTSYETKPVIEPEKLNERRKLVGLGTIEEYIIIMNKRYFGTLKK